MPSLADRLRARIAADGPLTFAAFMEAALYDPDGGFYARGARLGSGGAFTTAAIALPLFADALARELRDVHARLGSPSPFTVVEVGPGDGTLAARLAERLADLPLRLVLCDRSPAMLAAAARRVPGADSCSLAALPPVVGAIVANEVHDACPAHRLRWPAELYVGVGGDRRFREVEGERSGPRLERMLREAGVRPLPGARYDVSPAQADLQRTLALRLERGAILAFDYGEEGAARYTRPVERLRTYLAGMRGGDPLAAPGTQDITCDVDLGAVRRAGEGAGLTTLRCEGQDAWLRAHGALATAAALPAGSEQRLWLETFADPHGSGAAFRVLVQARGLGPPAAAHGVARIAP